MPNKEGANSSSTACLACRNKHLKCDGKTPVCSRCIASRAHCVYARSRRGYNGLRSKRAHQLAHASADVFEDVTTLSSPGNLLPATEPHHSMDKTDTPNYSETVSLAGRDASEGQGDQLTDVYYQRVHPAHPFVIPKVFYLKDPTLIPNHLKAAMRFMASQASLQNPDFYQHQASAVYESDVPRDGFVVQGLVLMTLGSFARFEREQGYRTLMRAVDLALEIGLHQDSFGYNQDPVLQESWRRTWWELYIIEGLISLITGLPRRLSQISSLALPGCCDEYESGRCNSTLRNIKQMQERWLMDNDVKWSSFAYRVEAMRIMNGALEIKQKASPREAQIRAVNASISSFLLSLPPDKRHGVKKNGDVDEVMFCGLMIIHLASICIHLPRSDLVDIRSFKTVCGNESAPTVANDRRVHTLAAIKSANSLSDMLVSRSSMKTMTPCFCCAVAFSTTVQLPAYLLAEQLSEDAQFLKENIQLALSALSVVGETWPIGRVIRGQLAQFARDILLGATTGSCEVEAPAAATAAASSQLNLASGLNSETWWQDFLDENRNMPMDDGFVFSSIMNQGLDPSGG